MQYKNLAMVYMYVHVLLSFSNSALFITIKIKINSE